MPDKNSRQPIARPKRPLAGRPIPRAKHLLPTAEVAAPVEAGTGDNRAIAPGFSGKKVLVAQSSGNSNLSPSDNQKGPAENPESTIQTKWKPAGLPLVSGMRELKAKGPIRIHGHSPVVGLDQVCYTVDWHPLDKDGNVLPVFRSDKPLEDRGAAAGQWTPDILKKPTIIKPPFDWPHGFRVTITVPPQAKTRRGSPGVQLQIAVPEDGLLK